MEKQSAEWEAGTPELAGRRTGGVQRYEGTKSIWGSGDQRRLCAGRPAISFRRLRGRIRSSKSAPSKVSSFALTAGPPPEYSPSRPSILTTRWHGIRSGIGFLAKAVPTARVARSAPIALATHRYERTSPAGIVLTFRKTLRWKGVQQDRSIRPENRRRPSR